MQQVRKEDDEKARQLNVFSRSEAGKSAARKLRKRGMIPAVFYGSRHAPVSISVSPDELVRALSTKKYRNTLLHLVCEGSEINGKMALVKDIQRQPLSREMLHVDFIEVYSDVLVKALIPIHLTGNPQGVEQGGTLDQHIRELEIRCPADKIPEEVQIDATHLEIGDSIKVAELPLGQEIEVLAEPEWSVASVAAPRVLEEVKPAEEEEAAAEGAEAEEGEKRPAKEEAEKKPEEEKKEE